jgi:perosamine synthetase
VLTTNDRRVYERAMLLGHHPHRLTAELTDPDLLALAGTGLGGKTRMPAIAAAIAAANLAGLPARMAAAETNLRMLHEQLTAGGAPITLPAVGAGSGWAGPSRCGNS